MSSSPSFEKVGECLYRNPSSGKYYALVKVRGKQIKRSLDADNLPTARRKLKDFKRELERIDPDAGRLDVEELCNRYLATITHQAPKTIRRKSDIVTRIKRRWKGIAARKVRKSEILAWLELRARALGELRAVSGSPLFSWRRVLAGQICRCPSRAPGWNLW